MPLALLEVFKAVLVDAFQSDQEAEGCVLTPAHLEVGGWGGVALGGGWVMNGRWGSQVGRAAEGCAVLTPAHLDVGWGWSFWWGIEVGGGQMGGANGWGKWVGAHHLDVGWGWI